MLWKARRVMKITMKIINKSTKNSTTFNNSSDNSVAKRIITPGAPGSIEYARAFHCEEYTPERDPEFLRYPLTGALDALIHTVGKVPDILETKNKDGEDDFIRVVDFHGQRTTLYREEIDVKGKDGRKARRVIFDDSKPMIRTAPKWLLLILICYAMRNKYLSPTRDNSFDIDLREAALLFERNPDAQTVRNLRKDAEKAFNVLTHTRQRWSEKHGGKVLTFDMKLVKDVSIIGNIIHGHFTEDFSSYLANRPRTRANKRIFTLSMRDPAAFGFFLKVHSNYFMNRGKQAARISTECLLLAAGIWEPLTNPKYVHQWRKLLFRRFLAWIKAGEDNGLVSPGSVFCLAAHAGNANGETEPLTKRFKSLKDFATRDLLYVYEVPGGAVEKQLSAYTARVRAILENMIRKFGPDRAPEIFKKWNESQKKKRAEKAAKAAAILRALNTMAGTGTDDGGGAPEPPPLRPEDIQY